MLDRWGRLLLVAAGLVFLGGGVSVAEPPGLTVFAAASLKNSLDEVDAAFTRDTGTPVHASYAASSVLAKQIEQGAPADAFISADADWMDDLAKHDLLKPGTRHDLLTNHLALIAPVSSSVQIPIGPGMALAAALHGGKLAMAGPDVPAGRYGHASLQALGVWPEVQGQIVYGESVRAALAYVSRGEAPLGIVYDTDAKIDPGVKIVGLFPDDSHPRIVYPAALIAASHAPPDDAYLRFVEGPQAAAIFRKYGFEVLR